MHTPIIKLTCILCTLLTVSFCKLTAQITINDVLGDYACTRNHLQTFTGPVISTCSGGVLRFVPASPSLCSGNDFSSLDSGCTTNSFVSVGGSNPIINTDSTFQECGGSPGFPVGGRYYANDSIYFKVKKGPDPDFYEYFGKKIITGIKELNLTDYLIIYPNPVSTVLTIELTNTNLWYKQSRVTIKNTLGQIVKTQELINNQQQIDVGYLPNGIYFMEVTTTKGILSKKIMVSN